MGKLLKPLSGRGDHFWVMAGYGWNGTFNGGVTKKCKRFRFWISPILCYPYQYKVKSNSCNGKILHPWVRYSPGDIQFIDDISIVGPLREQHGKKSDTC